MRIAIIFLAFLAMVAKTSAQQLIHKDYTKQQGSLRYGPNSNDVFPYSEKGYTLILPDGSNNIAGVLVSLDDSPFNQSMPRGKLIHPQAIAKGLAVLYISTGIPVDLFFKETSLAYVDKTLQEVFKKYTLTGKPVFLIGDMVSGHRALKYIEYCMKGKSQLCPDIKGVVLSESAIDWVRQWYEGQKQVRDHSTEASAFEGGLITYLFDANMKDSPVTNINKYIEFSAYSYFDTKMKKSSLFRDLAIRAYTYADIQYWFSAPGKGVYDSNYPDMSGFINEQKLAGNKKAELIVFHSNPLDGPKDSMKKQSSTWDQVDKAELVEWISRQLINPQ